MGGLFSLLSVARDGVLAQTAALNVTGQNVAGANTPGYVKRTVMLQSAPGGGVQASTVTRSFDRFTYAQLVDQSGKLSAATARSTAVSDVEGIVVPGTDTLSDRADALFAAFNQLALSPSDTGVRSAVLAKAGWLASGFADTANGLQSSRDELATRASDVAGEVNDRLASIAKLDQTIVSSKARGEDPSDLLDTRDKLVQDVADRIGARAVDSPNGGLTLFGAGTVLYEGGKAATVSATIDPTGALRIQADRSGNVVDVTKGITSGTLAGVIQARDSDIPGLQSSLDSYAKDITDAVNAVHVNGFALDGTTGRPLFAPTATVQGAAHSMALDPGIVDHPELIGASGAASDVPGGNDVAVLLSSLSNAQLGAGGTSAERYASITGKVGVLRNVSQSDETMRTDTMATATTLRESTSGVSTDEEMIQLQQFQRAFDASTRVLKTVNDLFDSVLAIVT
jgi:flagellar hook-associated protein 1 FlgK